MAQNSIEQITETIHTPKIFSQYDKKKIPYKQNRRVHKVDLRLLVTKVLS